jgi:hypothetical protein
MMEVGVTTLTTAAGHRLSTSTVIYDPARNGPFRAVYVSPQQGKSESQLEVMLVHVQISLLSALL